MNIFTADSVSKGHPLKTPVLWQIIHVRNYQYSVVLLCNNQDNEYDMRQSVSS